MAFRETAGILVLRIGTEADPYRFQIFYVVQKPNFTDRIPSTALFEGLLLRLDEMREQESVQLTG